MEKRFDFIRKKNARAFHIKNFFTRAIRAREKLSNVDAQSLKRIAFTRAGENVVKKGINMAEMIREPAQIIRGGGGGNTKLAQAGGMALDRLEDALQLYIEKVAMRLKHPQ